MSINERLYKKNLKTNIFLMKLNVIKNIFTLVEEV